MAQTYDGLPLGKYENHIWTDEFTWKPLEQEKKHGQTGLLIVQSGLKRGGRPITLTGDGVTRSQLDALYASLSSGLPKTLVLGDRQFSVYWDMDNNPIDAEPITPITEPWRDAELEYDVTYRFFTAN